MDDIEFTTDFYSPYVDTKKETQKDDVGFITPYVVRSTTPQIVSIETRPRKKKFKSRLIPKEANKNIKN